MLLSRKKRTALRAARAYLGELSRRFWIQVSYLGASGLWAGTITVALTKSVPDGVTAWLTWGIWMLFYQEAQLRTTIANTTNPVEKWRRTAMLWNVRLHIGCNAFVDVVLWWRVWFTPMKLSSLDQLSLLIGAATLLATWLVVLIFEIRQPIALFLYAVFSRVAEQATVAFSSSIAKLPPATVYGLLIVATVIVVNFGLEWLRARRAYKSTSTREAHEARNRLGWAFGSSVLNESSAILVNGSWQLAVVR